MVSAVVNRNPGGQDMVPSIVRSFFAVVLVVAVGCAEMALLCPRLDAQTASSDGYEVKRRWQTMNQIRRQKFDLVLPEVLRENQVDMWIVMRREGYDDPLTPDLGGGYVAKDGYYVFTDRGGDRIERAALGITGYLLERGGAYDIFGPADSLAEFVAERDPARIAINTSMNFGAADGLTHTGYLQLVETLGERYGQRLVSGEKLVSDFRSRRVATEIAAFAQAGEISKELAERALSNEVIVPGVTMLEDVAWWINQQLFERNLGLSFGMPSIYVTGPDGIVAVSNEHVIQRGDLLMIDWGVGLMNLYTDMKRIAYVLREGEVAAPEGFKRAFDRGVEARTIIQKTIRPGGSARQAMEAVYEALSEGGFKRIDFNQPTDDPKSTDVVIGCHSVGNTGHGIGPSIAVFNPVRLDYQLQPGNLLSIELFAYTAVPEFGGKKVRIPLEDDAVVTERGIEWLYPVNERILLIR
jgi:Xaa-Pro aminopeptidase